MSSETWGMPPGFGRRLKQERLRLGKSQLEFAQAGGVGRLSQIQYENETTAPTTRYLSKIADIQADLSFLVLGLRRGEGNLTAAQEERIDKIAFDLIEAYAKTQPGGQLSSDSRRILYRVLQSSLIQVELGILPSDFDPVTLIPGKLQAISQE